MKRFIIPLAVAALYACADSAPTEPIPRAASLRPLLGAFPGVNRRLAYVSDGSIYTRNPDGSDPQLLVDYGFAPAWSPDGSKLAFHSPVSGNNNIYVINADGTGRTQLTNNTGDVGTTNPTWSPDGSKIAFQNDLDGHIYVITSDGTSVTQLPGVGGNATPSWSPDGTRIAFMTTRNGMPEIYVMNADGTGQTRLTNNVDLDFDPSWSPDGSKILFMHDDAASSGDWPDIYTMNPDGTGQTNLTNTALFAEVSAVWSPDGTKIAFIGSTNDQSDVYVMNANNTDRTNISNTSAVNEFQLDWQRQPSAPVCVFGETFTRMQGPPARIVRNFSATPGSYSVDLDDLATSGADAVVTLNGVVIMEGRGTTGEVGPRHRVVEVTLLANNVLQIDLRGKKGSKLQVTICPSSGSQCYSNLPAPQLSLQSTSTNSFGNVEFQLDVSNYAQFPAALFAPSPDLPACGLNSSASRTWVDIFDGNGNRLYGFCALYDPSSLNDIWFATPPDQRPAEAYITLTDRRCNITYTSNRISLPGGF